MTRMLLIGLATIVGIILAAFLWMKFFHHGSGIGPMHSMGTGKPTVDVTVPPLKGLALEGSKAFAANCSACHGANAAGNEGVGPPLVHKIYEPSHHGDMAFVLAAKNGVRQHHWPYGNMPPVEGVSDADIKAIIAYVRTLQRANGIN